MSARSSRNEKMMRISASSDGAKPASNASFAVIPPKPNSAAAESASA